MRLPVSDKEIVNLAKNMIKGFKDHSDIYIAPPISVTSLEARVKNCEDFILKAKEMAAETSIAFKEKREEINKLKEDIRTDISYSEYKAEYNHEKLKLIGWGGSGQRGSLQAPGQVRELQITEQGKGWLDLKWKSPIDGGSPSAYKVERLDVSTDKEKWISVGMSYTTEVHIEDPPTSASLGYRVIAGNKKGEGMPSNSVFSAF